MILSEFENNKLVILNIPQDNSRKLMKIRLYLNVIQNITYELSKDLIIYFKVNDSILLSQEVGKIVSYIESVLGCQIKLETKLINQIEKTQNELDEFRNSLNKLQKLKNGQLDENYKLYCDFCDRTLSCKLREYQYTASYFLTIGKGGFDFSVPGSGKTIITYAAYNYFKYQGLIDFILIIGPINSYNAWFDEYYTCFNSIPNFKSLATDDKSSSIAYLLASKNNHSEITFINIDKAWRLKNELISFMKDKKVLLVIDEAHKEKNPDAEITKAVLEITKFANARIILTGTPMPNGYEDLYTLTKIYSPYEKIIPYSYQALKKMTKNGTTDKEQNIIINALKPVYSRVSKNYLLKNGELLPANYKFIKCELTKEQEELYDFLKDISYKINNDFESALNVGLMKAVLIRKMQVSANPGLLTKSIISSIDEYRNEYTSEYFNDESQNANLIKADKDLQKLIASSPVANLIYKFESGFYNTKKNETAIKLTIELVKSGQKVILWDVFVQNMNTLKRMLEQQTSIKIEMINGAINGENRQVAINNFKNGNSMVLIANPATLAESISLHKCCQNAIYVNRNFNAAQFIQSKDRIHRINMPEGKTATYYFLINDNTIDEEVQNRLKIKEDRMLRILDSQEIEIGGSEFDNNSFMSIEDIIEAYKK